jgi:putative ABC transport system permease protein
MGIPLLRGRDFTEADQLEAPRVVLINETMARRYFPNADPVGERLAMPDRENPRLPARDPWTSREPWSEIVGVVADVKSLGLRPEPLPQTYVPYWQWPMQSPTLVARATGNPAALAVMIREEVKAVVPNLPVPVIRTMDEILSETMAQPRFQAWLLSLFGIVALVLAAVGLYGVLAYAVSQRTHEIGIRMALGAQKRNVLSLVIGQGMRLALIGVGVGTAAAFALTRVMASLLYEVTPTDPLTFVSVAFLLLAIAWLACWLPARRAARVDPMEALRYE